MGLFTQQEQSAMKAPHVGRVFFMELFLPTGTRRLYSGYDTISLPLNGTTYEWQGMSDPFAGVMVSLSEIEEPRFGSAPTIELSLSGVTSAYMKSVKDIARQIEGVTVNTYFAMVDPEEPNEDGLIVGLKPLFPLGRASSPKLMRDANTRLITLTVESFFQSQNYPFGGMWNAAGQQRRYPGDKGLNNLGTDVYATRR